MTPKKFTAACNANREKIKALERQIEEIRTKQKRLEANYVAEHIPETGMYIGQKVVFHDTVTLRDGSSKQVKTVGYLTGGYPDTHPQGDGGIYLQFFGEKKNGEPSKRITRTEYFSVKDNE